MVLIDAGVGHAAHLDAIARHSPAGPGHVIVTHGHSDHASGAPALAARWPSTIFSKRPWRERDGLYDVTWQPLADGAMIPAGDDPIQAIHTPGHSPDHLSFWHEPSRTLFCGDLLVLGSTVVIPASHGGSLAEYLQSLGRVLALGATRILPAHGAVIEDPAAVIAQYVEHRRRREGQVLAALEGGADTVEAMVDRIYADLASDLVGMARESVLAHLMKLEQEGLARQSSGKWSIVR
jgi:glyoxylase-like metal-dependent hydrolase (beta-lactamase superfamily II)